MSNPAEIKGSFCPKCGWTDMLKSLCCPRCHSQMPEKTFLGHGTIATFTVVRYPPIGFESESPYVVALIDIADGPRVIGRVNGPLELMSIGKSVLFVGESRGALDFKLRG